MSGSGTRNGGANGTLGQPRPLADRWASRMKLFYPGMGIKRWLLAGGLGIGVCSIGVVFLLRKLFAVTLPDFLPSYLEGVAVLAVGVAIILLAIFGLYRSIGPLIQAPPNIESLADTIYARRSRGRGPRIVAIGGGTGMSVLLRGLKSHTDNLTAIITVADDGGNSGRLRRELSMPPPGDFRNCLVALSESETLLAELFQYRFDQGNGLKGHSFGNLFIAAMSNITDNFEQALSESSKVLAVRGQIVPATVASISLSALLKDGTVVRGESSITKHGGQIERLFIEPSEPEAYPLAVEAVEQAHMIVVGPGSLYTSVLPNLLVPDLASAVVRSSATKVYVCNVATEKGETEGYTVADHVAALESHTDRAIVNHVLANDNAEPRSAQDPVNPVVLGGEQRLAHVVLEAADLVDMESPLRHEATKLAQALMDVWGRERKGLRLSTRS